MNTIKPIHADFEFLLGFKEQALITLFRDLRKFILEIHPSSNELLYHTHALTTVFTLSDKLSDAFCMIPIYAKHLNLGFNKGTLLKDPKKLLQGTGNLIRHIPVTQPGDYRNAAVKALIKEAILFSEKDLQNTKKITGQTISKIKK